MYLSKESILKAYEVLSKATPKIPNNFSAIQYFVATDRFYKEHESPCDSANTDNKNEFYEYVKDAVSLDDSYYLSTFKVIYNGTKSVNATVSSNFFNGSSVDLSKNTPGKKFDYPKKYPLLSALDGKVYKEDSYYSNLSDYLNGKEKKFALAIWLLRKNGDFNDLSFNEFRNILNNYYSSLFVDTLIPTDIDISDIEMFSLTCETDVANIEKKDIVGINSMRITGISNIYLTALRTKPFMLLAGISGTGKSRIVREMAKACWKEGDEEYGKNNPRNFCMVQVKPNWHDSTELMGYVTRISGTPEYIPGPFLRFLAAAIKEPEVPYFLCLDEMNLAPVEQYFAEYLSVIESRKLNADGTITTDPIIKPEGTQEYHDLIGKLLGDEERKKGTALTIPQNLFVVGTVNMDETTFSFSRKVLDRAMTIEMNEVDLHGGLEKGAGNEIGYIGNSIIGDAAEGCDVYEDNKALCDDVLNYLVKVNEILEGTPFKIAYRTRNEFLMYAVNRQKLAPESQLWQTLDEMTSMKILSRIEGDSDRTQTVLEKLKALVDEQIVVAIPPTEDGQPSVKSITATKIDEMLEKLKSGFTSYWT